MGGKRSEIFLPFMAFTTDQPEMTEQPFAHNNRELLGLFASVSHETHKQKSGVVVNAMTH